MGKIISFINMKGGVGKTTLAVNVSYTLAKEFNKKVLLVDVDPQMNATQYVLNETQVVDIMDHPNKSIYGILNKVSDMPPMMMKSTEETTFNGIMEITDKLDLIPSHLNVMSLYLNDHPYTLLRFLERVKNSYDAIIIDSPPTISPYTKISLLASDAYVVPMRTDALSFFGLPLLQNYIDLLKEEFDRDLTFLGIILNMVVPEHTIYSNIKSQLNKKPEWGEKIFKSELKQRTAIPKALSPEDKSEKLPYIIELEDSDLKSQMIEITREFMKLSRL